MLDNHRQIPKAIQILLKINSFFLSLFNLILLFQKFSFFFCIHYKNSISRLYLFYLNENCGDTVILCVFQCFCVGSKSDLILYFVQHRRYDIYISLGFVWLSHFFFNTCNIDVNVHYHCYVLCHEIEIDTIPIRATG